MTASTHRALVALDLYAVDDEHAREILSTVANVIIPTGGVLRMECSPPARRTHTPGSLPTNSEQQGEWVAARDLELLGTLARGCLAMQDAIGREPGIPHRNRIEALLDRLGVDELGLPDPHAGEVVPLHRDSRA